MDVDINWLYVRNKIATMFGKSDVNVKVERVNERLFTHRLYFIYARNAIKVYVRTHVKITRQWNIGSSIMFVAQLENS